jgi:hypothetical protein
MVMLLDADNVGGLGVKYTNNTQVGVGGINGWVNLAPSNGLNPSSNLDLTCRDTFNEWNANSQAATNNFASVNPPLYKTSGGFLNNKPFINFVSTNLNWLTQRVTTPQQITVTNGLTWFGCFYGSADNPKEAFTHGGSAPNISLRVYRNSQNFDPRTSLGISQDWRIHTTEWLGPARNNRNNLNFFLIKRTSNSYQGYVGGLDKNYFYTVSGLTSPTNLGNYKPYVHMGCAFLETSLTYNRSSTFEMYNVGIIQRPTTEEEDQLILNYFRSKFSV